MVLVDPDDELVTAATATTLLVGGAVHTAPDTLTGAVNDDLVPQVDVPVTLQRGVGVASVGLGLVEAMELLDRNMR